ncbi:hypothetical protein RHDE110596_19690 [Prescottella defluvii]
MGSIYEIIGIGTASLSAQVMKGIGSLFVLSGYPAEGPPK